MSLAILGLLSMSLIFSSAYAAPLRSQAAIPSNNIVSTTSTYEILFTTATTGTIKTIEIAFPVGYSIVGTGVVERIGIGAGTIQKTGTTIIYSVTSPVSIPANTPIRLELANIVNNNIKSAASVSITTKDSAGTKIDGPTLSSTFIRNIGTNDIAGSAVTTAKIADQNVFTNDLANNVVTAPKVSPALMYTKQLNDGACDQNSNGWCPDRSRRLFTIIDPTMAQMNSPKTVEINFIFADNFNLFPFDSRCQVDTMGNDRFFISCDSAPVNSHLIYTSLPQQSLPNNFFFSFM